jgi:hypothetical protein
MNNIAISPRIFMYALQNQNFEIKTTKKLDIKQLNESITNDNNEEPSGSKLETN